MKLKTTASNTSATHSQQSFNGLREQADRERRNRRANPEVQDGRYGFGENGELLHDTSHRLYSDEMMVDAAPQKNQQRRRRQ